MKNVTIVGGGIAGLVTAIQLARENIQVTLMEKNSYPLHKVCGEYISNEAAGFLRGLGLYPEAFSPPEISRLQLTSVSGNSAIIELDSGGFGISRYAFDLFLSEKAKEAGVQLILDTPVESIRFDSGKFEVKTRQLSTMSDLVIGAFGKRSTLDVSLGRSFIRMRSPYVGVKYHVRWEHPANLISLHNFKNGYCGMSQVENGVVNLCYMSHRDNLRQAGSIPALEKTVLSKNPFLKTIFTNAEFLFEKPEVINEIFFETKAPVEGHILMAGDAAGMITPLCGNGMAMAIHSSKILSKLVVRFCYDGLGREKLETLYTEAWKRAFSRRLWAGRQIQRFFGSEMSSTVLVNIARHGGSLARWLVSQTHGSPF